jgi:transposase
MGSARGSIYTWRKQMLRAAMAGFAAVEIKPDAQAALPAPVQDAPPLAVASSRAMAGAIEVELPSGVRLRLGSDVDGTALQRVLAALAAP